MSCGQAPDENACKPAHNRAAEHVRRVMSADEDARERKQNGERNQRIAGSAIKHPDHYRDRESEYCVIARKRSVSRFGDELVNLMHEIWTRSRKKASDDLTESKSRKRRCAGEKGATLQCRAPRCPEPEQGEREEDGGIFRDADHRRIEEIASKGEAVYRLKAAIIESNELIHRVVRARA